MISLVPIATFVEVLAHADRIALTAYTLRDGAVRSALVAAARRGATVSVRLERDPLDDAAGTLHAANAAAVAALRAAGAAAALTGPAEPVLHMKAAVVDGVAWLDDRNWAGSGPESVVCDSDADDVAAVAAAVAGGPGGDAHLATTKSGALRLEADTIERAGDGPLAVESESFRSGTIYNALLRRAKAGRPTRLIVAAREALDPAATDERKRLAKLAGLGVAVKLGDPARGDLDEKLAVGPREAWTGSANATYARGAMGAQRDWGLGTRAPALVGGLAAAFERNWARALPLPAPTRD